MGGVGGVRALFPALKTYTYLDASARAPLADPVRRALDAFLDDRQSGAYTKPRWFERVETAREKFARLIHAHPDEVAFTKNTSEGLNIIAQAFPWQPGDEVLVAPDLEHPSNVYPWLNLRQRGVAVRILQPAGPALGVENVAAHCTARTRMISLAGVSFSTGGRQDLAAIGALCRERGIFLCVDGVQLVGFLDVDPGALGVDALSLGTNKGLLNLYGLGLLWVRRDRIEGLTPAYLSRFGVDVAGAEETLGELDYRLLPSARRFEVGNYNYMAIHGLDAALDLLLGAGMEAVHAHNLRLARRLAQGLAEAGYRVVSPTAEPYVSHVVVFEPGAHSRYKDMESLAAACERERIRMSVRRGRVRMSFHLYNSDEDVARVLEVLG
ncbi:MAG TPA: aminotransferase class V-fold PLP-dependent enzyme [Limnochordales bacterium]